MVFSLQWIISCSFKIIDVLFGAELKPRGYYLEHVFYLDCAFPTNMSHEYYLDQ